MIEEPVVKASGSVRKPNSRVANSSTSAAKRAEVLHEQRDLEQQLRFGLAARELHGRDRLLHLREPQLQLRSPARSRGSPGVP